MFDSTVVTAATEDVGYSYTITTRDVDVEAAVGTAGGGPVHRVVGVHHPRALLQDAVGEFPVGVDRRARRGDQTTLDLIRGERRIGVEQQCGDPRDQRHRLRGT